MNTSLFKKFVVKRKQAESLQDIDGIYCPIDVKNIHMESIQFAVRLAQVFSATLVLGTIINYDSINDAKLRMGIYRMRNNILKETCKKIEAPDMGIKIRTSIKSIREGMDISKTIVHTCSSESCDMIAVCSRGLRNINTIINGSISSNIMKYTSLPVCIIPNCDVPPSIRTIGFSSQYTQDEILHQDLREVIRVGKCFDAMICFFHVKLRKKHRFPRFRLFRSKSRPVCIVNNIDSVSNGRFQNEFNSYQPKIYVLMDGYNTVRDAVRDAICVQNMDMLVMTRRPRNKITSIIQKSVTKDVSLDTKIPIIIFEQRDNLSGRSPREREVLVIQDRKVSRKRFSD
jgi:nucleotide-binding universal stress UspA family protein